MLTKEIVSCDMCLGDKMLASQFDVDQKTCACPKCDSKGYLIIWKKGDEHAAHDSKNSKTRE